MERRNGRRPETQRRDSMPAPTYSRTLKESVIAIGKDLLAIGSRIVLAGGAGVTSAYLMTGVAPEVASFVGIAVAATVWFGLNTAIHRGHFPQLRANRILR